MREAILALLAAGPLAARDLIAAVGAAGYEVRRALRALAEEGQLKKVGTHKKWALATYQRPRQTGRRPGPGPVLPKPRPPRRPDPLSWWCRLDRAALQREALVRSGRVPSLTAGA